jgi:hypothetical protein
MGVVLTERRKQMRCRMMVVLLLILLLVPAAAPGSGNGTDDAGRPERQMGETSGFLGYGTEDPPDQKDFGELDRSDDGRVTMEDLEPAYGTQVDEEIFARLDLDGDGALDEQEWENAKAYLDELNIHPHQTAGRGSD